MYLYKTTLFTNTTNVIGLNVAQNNADVADFETTHKASCTQVSNIELAETTFVIELGYTAFEAKIVSPVLWSDVKYIQGANTYELHLLSESPI